MSNDWLVAVKSNRCTSRNVVYENGVEKEVICLQITDVCGRKVCPRLVNKKKVRSNMREITQLEMFREE